MPTTDSYAPELDDVDLRRSWLAYGGVGLALVGAGLSVAMDAGHRRAGGAGAAEWTTRGTVGLTLVGAGLSVFGEAVARRVDLLARARAR